LILGLKDKEEKKIEELNKTALKLFELQIKEGRTVRYKFA
jgi:hypothetical protein